MHEDAIAVVAAARTPIGGFQGALAGATAATLGGVAIRAAQERAGLPGSRVESSRWVACCPPRHSKDVRIGFEGGDARTRRPALRQQVDGGGRRHGDVERALSEVPVSPAVLAGDVGMSTRQLERLFRRYLGRSPKRYYMELRLQKARNLLQQSDMSVINVALACGFASPSHFSKCYRALYKTTPYRERGASGGPA
jgi:AraC-like DNA-binding protein